MHVSAGFDYITPITIGTRYIINHVRLVSDRWSEFGVRKYLLKSLEVLIYNLNAVPSKNCCR